MAREIGLFALTVIYIKMDFHCRVIAKRASDVMTQTRLRQTNRNSGPVSNEYVIGNFSKLKKRIIIAKGRICTRFLTFFSFLILFSITCLSWS